ncbi:MAG: hypothetical protein RDV48_06045 [Candidatus Eremiobacteraeota bacterium]|nr:hypothetical protein [Candidatus Eremiobacteraeota bacterium]
MEKTSKGGAGPHGKGERAPGASVTAEKVVFNGKRIVVYGKPACLNRLETKPLEDIMKKETRTIWERFIAHTEEKAKKSGADPSKLRAKASALAEKYRSKGYLPFTPSEAVNDDPLLYPFFYEELGKGQFRDGAIPSPVEGQSDSAWMLGTDFCFINIRALSPKKSKTGTISDAFRLLPIVRAGSFHLAPFFDCTMHNLYAIDSLRILTEDIVDHELLEAGIAPDDQMRLLIDAIHILGKTVGFDLEPHTSQFSRVVLENPQHFRWLHLDKSRKGLQGGFTHEKMFSPAEQAKIVKEVKELIGQELKKHGLTRMEDLSQGVTELREAHCDILEMLIAKGYWTLPSHTWNGVGLPKFNKYSKEGGYPDFTYLDIEGEDQHDQSFGMLTPFSLYTNLPFNEVPTPEDPPVYKEDTFKFLTGIFPKILEKYDFDFLRIDYVDHIFDSTVDESWDIPLSDRMTPKVLAAVIEKAREAKPWLGTMAERMGQDIWDYQKVGFDLVLGQDILTTMHPGYLTWCLETHEKIKSQAPSWKRPASVLFAVDTHDSGHPLFWTTPVSQVIGARGMALRHFISRFLYAGGLRRPKYECIGNQDLSYGLYETNNNAKSLTWVGDKEYCRRYHALENVYEELKPLIASSVQGPLHIDRGAMWWFLDCRGEKPSRILCYANLEREVKKVKVLAEKKPVYEAVKDVYLYLYENSPVRNAAVTEIDVTTGKKKHIEPDRNGCIFLKEVEPLGVRLYVISEAG